MSVEVCESRVRLSFAPRERLLASYLFEFPGRVHRREQLTDMFWPERPPRQARAAMNTALWKLRRLLALDGEANHSDSLQTSSTEISFESDSQIEIDTHRFDSSVRKALMRISPSAHGERLVELERAADCYRGRFLDGDDEEDWVVAERERLHSLYVRCLSELMRSAAGQSDYESAIYAARKILAVDNFREVVMRSLAILLFLNGQRAQAIHELDRWQRALAKDVGVGPMPETAGLLSALLSGAICQDIVRWRSQHLATPVEN